LGDPCEKETVDAAAEIKMQEAEDLTAAAQVIVILTIVRLTAIYP
jgi:hypothetical protein